MTNPEKTILDRLSEALFARLTRLPARRRRRHAAALAVPFPRAWLETLSIRCRHYERLPAAYQNRFRQQVQIFLSEARITGVEMDVDEGTILLVAASAVSLSVGWPGYTWDQLAEVLLYPDYFDRDYKFGRHEIAGMVHPWGTVIISVPALHRSFDENSNAYHVGFHEFAHLLDLEQARIDGVPPGLADDSIRRWMTIVEAEEDRLRRGESMLDAYALASQAEFFATSIEAFLQAPATLADHHHDLYSFLSSYFCQDPAAWSRSGK